MDDRSDSDFDPLPLQPETPDPEPPDPTLSPQAVKRALGTRHRPPPVEIDLTRVVRLLYSHNPFYCISAFLVLWGLVKSFHFHGVTPRPELLMAGLAGYGLLLAAIGCLLIRAGQLWEDIRTILLLIVIIFMACSMSFDEVLVAGQTNGRFYFLGGLAFAVVVSELVLRGVRLRLPMLYRLPYYAMLAMFFLYPLLLAPWQGPENAPSLRWRLAGFAPLAGLVALTLLPAVRRGANYVRDNGSPWQWPWYPWPLFVVLAVGVGMRSYSLCISFHPSRGPATIFEPYVLVPPLLAVSVLLLEIAIYARRPSLLRAMMAAPLGLLVLSTWTFAGIPDSINLRPMLLQACGCSPLFLTLLAVVTFYAVALMRRVPQALHCLTIAMALLIVIGPTTGSFWGPWSPRPWPLLQLAAIQLFAAIRYRSGLHWLLTASCAIAAICFAWPEAIGTRWHGAFPAHLLLVATLLIGAILRDPVARFLQGAGFTGIVFAALFVISGGDDDCPIPRPEVVMFYPGVMFLLATGYGYWVRNRWYRAVALLVLAAWSIALGGRGYGALRPAVAGLDEIALGTACLLLGLTVSLWKLRIPQNWWTWWLRRTPIPVAPIVNKNAANDRLGEVDP